ncbi:MAG: hypothetical protein ABR502_00265 [Chitinophagaceae bacterium]
MRNLFIHPADQTNYDKFSPAQNQEPDESVCYGLVDLDNIVQKALENCRNKIKQLGAIIRCDALPLVIVDEAPLKNFFCGMISMVLDHSLKGTKLFIHIKCRLNTSDEMDMRVPKGFSKFKITFHSNLKTDKDWLHLYKETLQKFESVIKPYGGEIHYHEVSTTGLLFSLLVTGKLN